MEIDLPLLGRVLGDEGRQPRRRVAPAAAPFLGRAGPGPAALPARHVPARRLRGPVVPAPTGDPPRHRATTSSATGAEPAVLSLHFWRGRGPRTGVPVVGDGGGARPSTPTPTPRPPSCTGGRWRAPHAADRSDQAETAAARRGARRRARADRRLRRRRRAPYLDARRAADGSSTPMTAGPAAPQARRAARACGRVRRRAALVRPGDPPPRRRRGPRFASLPPPGPRPVSSPSSPSSSSRTPACATARAGRRRPGSSRTGDRARHAASATTACSATPTTCSPSSISPSATPPPPSGRLALDLPRAGGRPRPAGQPVQQPRHGRLLRRRLGRRPRATTSAAATSVGAPATSCWKPRSPTTSARSCRTAAMSTRRSSSSTPRSRRSATRSTRWVSGWSTATSAGPGCAGRSGRGEGPARPGPRAARVDQRGESRRRDTRAARRVRNGGRRP